MIQETQLCNLHALYFIKACKHNKSGSNKHLNTSHDHTPLGQLVAGHEPIVDVGVLHHEGLGCLPAAEHEGGPGEVPHGPGHHQPPLPLVASSQSNDGVPVRGSPSAEIINNRVLQDIVRVDGGRTEQSKHVSLERYFCRLPEVPKTEDTRQQDSNQLQLIKRTLLIRLVC